MIRLATPADASEVAALLDEFNREYDTPTPGTAVLARRLETLLGETATFGFLAGAPAVGLALVTHRPNTWYDGPVALLDELYVRPGMRGRGVGGELIDAVLAHGRATGVGLLEVNVDESDTDALRFYARHGLELVQPDTGERAFYLSRELD